jgi:hypothetical protein
MRASIIAPGAQPSTPPARPHGAVVGAARRGLRLSYDAGARAAGANANTVHRWRAGETAPSPGVRGRRAASAHPAAAVRDFLGWAGAARPAGGRA